MENKRSRPNEMATKHKVQWKISLPEDIWDHVFLNYCDFDSIMTTRMLQSKYVKHCTESNDFNLAIRGINLNNVKWIYQYQRVKLKAGHFNWAARGGSLSIIKWLRGKGCPWSYYTFAEAATCGDLNNMKWLRTKECPWDSLTFQRAAEHGDLINVKWLRANDCPWDSFTIEGAALNGHLEVLEWLIIKKCPRDKEKLKLLDLRYSVIEWLVNHAIITK